MRLINTRTLELTMFTSPESVKGGYAILSHCWNEQEQTLQDIQKIYKRAAKSGQDPHPLICDKIRRFCALAQEHGFEWAWIDTCCIDKTSSAELSEAINSMYQYYSLAAVCYAYLEDVPTEDALVLNDGRPGSRFKFSKWHTRGWTLQELVAPRVVLFVSSSWDVLGTKADLSAQLQQCTKIPEAVLHMKQTPASLSVAQRMSWASQRKTTRTEDEAYCLMGLFDITMPTLYGEGKKAFQRLQEIIMQTLPDTTIFAWDPLAFVQPGDL